MDVQEEIAEAPSPRKNRGGRPRKVAVDVGTVLQMPEIQSAIASAVAEATARIIADIETKRAAMGTSAASSGQSDSSLARTLAVELANLADQGSHRKRIDPAILESRREARDRMTGFIIDARAANEIPEYELKRAVYLDEILVAPTYVGNDRRQRRTRIEWPGIPNEAMLPKNVVAERIFAAFMDSIGGLSPFVNKKSEIEVEREAVRKGGGLNVMHKPALYEAPPVGKPRGGEMRILGRSQPGEIVETNVLGTLAAPARQLA